MPAKKKPKLPHTIPGELVSMSKFSWYEKSGDAAPHWSKSTDFPVLGFVVTSCRSPDVKLKTFKHDKWVHYVLLPDFLGWTPTHYIAKIEFGTKRWKKPK
jgi:hypothetical protein